MKLVFNIKENIISHRGEYLTLLCRGDAYRILGVVPNGVYRLTFRTTKTDTAKRNSITLRREKIGNQIISMWRWDSIILTEDKSLNIFVGVMDEFLTKKFGKKTVHGTFKVDIIA